MKKLKLPKKKMKSTNNTEEKVITKKKKISNLYKLIIGLIFIILTIISFILFGALITGVIVIGMLLVLFFTIVLDIYPQKSKMRKIIKAIFILFIIFGIVGICLFIAFFTYIVAKAPTFDVANLEVNETTIIYNNKNEPSATLGSEKREKVTYDELPEVFVDALVATEDSRFFQHNGFDVARFVKASLGQVVGGSGGGASTLTMQVSKNSFTSTDVSITRKFTDIYLSIFKIEKAFTKQQIMEFYVNNFFLGNNSYGVEQASKTYFDKDVSELNLSEASLIAGLFQAPSSYDPFTEPEAAEERRNTVLNLMVQHGYITKEEKELAESISVTDLLKTSNSGVANKHQDYIDQVVKEVKERYGIDPYYTSLEIYTNMNEEKQTAIENVYNGTSYTWPNDSIQAGVVAIESKTGKIIAIGGGRNRSGELTFSYATDIKRQIGSTAKPFYDYGPGMEYENWSTAKIFNDSPTSYTNGGQMSNWDNSFKGNITLRYALADSRNVPALQAFQSLDNSKIYNFVTKAGLSPEVSEGSTYIHEAHSIGAYNGESPLTMAGAYASISNGGTYHEPYTVNKIVFRSTGDEVTYEPEETKVMSDSTAYMLTSVMTDIASANGVNLTTGGDMALKTGSTNYDSETSKAYGYPSNATPDGWMAGFTPEITMVQWTGYVNNVAGQYLTQNQMASHKAALYRASQKAILNDQTGKFEKPSSVTWVTVEKGTEMLASATTPDSMKVTELFKRGTEPTEVSSAYNVLDNVSGLNIKADSGNVKLTWNAAAEPGDINKETYGTFGYKVYLNNNLLGFTENNYYNYDGSNPYGTYKVVTCYSNVSTNQSSGSTVSYESKVTFNASISNETVAIGGTYSLATDKNTITVTENGTDVTSNANIEATITDDSTSTVVNSVDTTIAGSYTITFKISYSGKNKTYTKIVTVQ